MKLNKESKDLLRIKVDQTLYEKIKYNPYKRIKLEKEDLEDLLFDEKIDKAGRTYKVFGYTGNSLCKLDLSEISCENVKLDYGYYGGYDPLWLKYTNINFDISKSRDYIVHKKIDISNMNLEHVNLSKNNFADLTKEAKGIIDQCNLRYSSLNLEGANITIYYSDLSCNNLSSLEFIAMPDPDKETDEDIVLVSNSIELYDCNLTETGARIKADMNDEKILKCISKMIENDKLGGCYLNGKMIMSHENRLKQKTILLDEYKMFCEEKEDKIMKLINEQMEG